MALKKSQIAALDAVVQPDDDEQSLFAYSLQGHCEQESSVCKWTADIHSQKCTRRNKSQNQRSSHLK